MQDKKKVKAENLQSIVLQIDGAIVNHANELFYNIHALVYSAIYVDLYQNRRWCVALPPVFHTANVLGLLIVPFSFTRKNEEKTEEIVQEDRERESELNVIIWITDGE